VELATRLKLQKIQRPFLLKVLAMVPVAIRMERLLQKQLFLQDNKPIKRFRIGMKGPRCLNKYRGFFYE